MRRADWPISGRTWTIEGREEETMFEHLDDPAPPVPTGRTLGAVLARAAALRRRRVGSALGVVGAGALAFGIVIGLLVSAGPHSQTFAVFDSQSGLLPSGTPVPPSDLATVVFAGDLRGFGLAVRGQQTLLASTTDGGDTWSVVDPSLPVAFPAQFEFADAVHGYLWGATPSSSGAVPLWVTADGGQRWRRASIGPVVSDVSAIGPDVWAVVGPCPVRATPGPLCPVVVEVSVDDGATWAATPGTPPLSEDAVASLSDQSIELARITVARAYVLSFASPTSPASNSSTTPASSPSTSPHAPGGRLAFTDDGGRTWSTRPDPCPTSFGLGEQVAASGTDDLWLVCASEASAGAQAKALYRSDDGGLQWSLAATANAPALTGTTLPVTGDLPVAGYVAPYSLGHENLAVLTPTTAWLFPDRASVFETTDGGRSWAVVAGLSAAGLVAGPGTGNVVFVDATHGWVCDAGIGLWRTTNGTDWERLGS